MRRPDDDPDIVSSKTVLGTMRLLSFSFFSALATFLLVLVLVDPEVDDPPISPTVAALVLLVLGFGLVLTSWRITRALPCEPAPMFEAYRTQWFLRIALAEVSALFGFAGAIVTGSVLVYIGGAIPTVVGFARNAPTAPNLRREDELLRDRGCPQSLTEVLSGAHWPTGPAA